MQLSDLTFLREKGSHNSGYIHCDKFLSRSSKSSKPINRVFIRLTVSCMMRKFEEAKTTIIQKT